LDVEPSQLRFRYNRYGKPALAGELAEDWLRFNLSHSHGLALYAFTENREIGVDLEFIRPELAGEEIARRFFSSAEAAELAALPSHLRTEAFFNCWTRKEAYIKARGKGLSLPLDQFDVSLAPGKPAALLRARGEPDESSRWSLTALAPAQGYVAALAVEGHAYQLRCWRWEGN
jgi:4'-phosphopantetheinyl transferase